MSRPWALAAALLALTGCGLVFGYSPMRFTGYLCFCAGAAALLWGFLSARRERRWARIARRGVAVCLALGTAVFAVLEIQVVRWSRTDTEREAAAVVVLGAGVNGTEPSLSLQTRLDKALEYLERWPDIPAVLTGGTGYGEEISEARCMYDYLTERGVDPDRLILEDQAGNTAENFALSRPLLEAAGVDPAADTVAVVTNDFHIARSELIAARQGYGDTVGIPAPLPWPHLTVNYYLREAFALVKTVLLD